RVRLDRVGEREIKSDIGSEVFESKEEIVDALRLERADSIRGKIFALMGDFHELLLSELDENVKMNLGARDKILDSELTKGRRVFAMHARSGCATESADDRFGKFFAIDRLRQERVRSEIVSGARLDDLGESGDENHGKLAR